MIKLFLMCKDCEYHKSLIRDSSNHAVANSSVEIGTGNERKSITRKPMPIRKKVTVIYSALDRAKKDLESGALDGIPN